MGDDGHREGILLEPRHRETDSVDRDGALRDEVGCALRRISDGEKPAVGFPRHRLDGACSVYVSLHDVSVEKRVGPHRPLEVYFSLRLVLPERSFRQGLLDCDDVERAVVMPHNGETDAVDRHALIDAQFSCEIRLHGKAPAPSQIFDPIDFSDGFYDTCEHICMRWYARMGERLSALECGRYRGGRLMFQPASVVKRASSRENKRMESAVPAFILESVRSLPALPASAGKLLEMARDPDADFKAIARVIELDPTLTARVLRAANSAMYGVPRRVQTVQQATVLLGRDTVVNLALSISVLSMQSHFEKHQWPFDPADFWRHSFAVASLARRMAMHIPDVNADEAYVAGLLHDIGKLVMLDHFDAVYAQVVMAAQDGIKPLFLLERETVDTDHAVVGHALCLHWKIPASITRAVAEHHDADDSASRTVADVVRNANDLAKAAHIGNSGSQFAELRQSLALPSRAIGPDRLRTMIVGLPADVDDAEHVFGKGKGDEVKSPSAAIERTVHLHIEDLAERDFVRCVLWSAGYHTEPVDDAFPPESARIAAMLSDGPLPGRTVSSYLSADIPVLDYAAWRAEQGTTAPNHFNVASLRRWIDQIGKSALTEGTHPITT